MTESPLSIQYLLSTGLAQPASRTGLRRINPLIAEDQAQRPASLEEA
jgi:hypothetical protein